MSDAPTTPRRIRFSLRSLFVLVVIVSIPCAWVAYSLNWIRQRHGGLRSPRDTIAHACGFEPTEGPLLDYLEAKFGELYRL